MTNPALFAAEPPLEHNIVRRFLTWFSHADSDARADAATALARAYLYSDLDPVTRAEAELGLAALLDDPSAHVRRALAEALASAENAPHAIVLALASDQSEVAAVVLARSPALLDADLVDCAAIGDQRAQVAIASRAKVNVGVSAALIEIGGAEAVAALLANPDARIGPVSLKRLIERFGDDAAMREAVLERPNLPAALRHELVSATASTLAKFVSECGWLAKERAERITRDAREQATASLAIDCSEAELAGLIAHLRASGVLTVALMMRAALSGDRAFCVVALKELSGLPAHRAEALAREPRGQGFAALCQKAGLSPAASAGLRACLSAIDSACVAAGANVSRAAAEAAIAELRKIAAPGLGDVVSFVSRLSVEAAREEARAFLDLARLEIDAAEPARLSVVAEEPEPLSAAAEEAVTLAILSSIEGVNDEDEVIEYVEAEPKISPIKLAEFGAAAPVVALPDDVLEAMAEAA